MIGTFWNLCRACPSVPVDKLHSEYRSTYRWHEFTGATADVIRRPPQTATSIGNGSCELAFPRRRKHPELAYRAHDFLVSLDGGTENLLGKTGIYDRARSEERWAQSDRQRTSRRSKSEGPPTEATCIPSANMPSTFSKSAQRGNSRPSYQLLNNNDNSYELTDGEDKAGQDVPDNINKRGNSQSGASEYKLQFAWPPVSAVLGLNKNFNVPRKSISMNGIKTQETVPVHRRHFPAKFAGQRDLIINGTLPRNIKENDAPEHRSDKDFKTEYKKQFQPFYNYNFDESRGTFEKKPSIEDTAAVGLSKEAIERTSNWYKEVVLLRKKANQYRHRGWGTELVPEHIAQLYNDQITVWEQVSRRSTLSALSLATTLIKSREDDKEKEPRRGSPSKSLTRARSVKGDTTDKVDKPSRSSRSKTEQRSATQRTKKMIERPKGTRSRSSGAADAAAPTAANQPQAAAAAEATQRRPARPTSLVTHSVSRKNPEVFTGDGVDIQLMENGEIEETEQLIKSPPEPTRVRSPEQMMIRSPDPVNWTVPLDTGKTFTVTQNIREGELMPRSFSDARAHTPSHELLANR